MCPMPRWKRTRYRSARECELDMRCYVRDANELRWTRSAIKQILKKKRQGWPPDEIEYAKLKAKENRLVDENDLRFERLLVRMLRIRADAERMEALLDPRRARHGNAANA